MTPIWNPFSAEFIRDPFPVYAKLREQHPVYLNETYGFYALSRFEDVVEANRNWAAYSNANGVDLDRTGTIFFAEGNVVEADPPDHTALRTILKDYLTPTFFREKETAVVRRVENLVKGLEGKENADLAAEFCVQLPLGVISELLGIDSTNQQWVYEHFIGLLHREDGRETIPESSLQTAREVREFLTCELRARRKSPRDDLMSTIAHAEKAGVPLSESEQIGMSTLIFFAGMSTTKNLLTNIFWHLAKDASLRTQVESAVSTAALTVEEFLRYESPIQASARTTTRDVEVHGVTIPKGATVTLLYGSANRDDTVFESADVLNINRKIPKHMAFGGGVHLCLGAPLARIEARIALQYGLTKMPGFTLADKPERCLMWNERGLETLPVKFDANWNH
jgi:cytochrome P450